MSRYRHIPPNAYRPYGRQVYPAWQEPSPVVQVAYPQPPPPGEQYLYDQRFVYCAGGESNRGVTLPMYAGAKDRSMLQQMTWDPYAVHPLVPVMGSRSVALGEDIDDLDELDDLDLLDVDDLDDDLDGIDPWDQMMVQIGLSPEEAEVIEAFGAKERKRLFKRRAPGERPKVAQVFRNVLQKIEQAGNKASYKARAAQEKLDEVQQQRAEAAAPPPQSMITPPQPMIIRVPEAAAQPSGMSTGAVAAVAVGTLIAGLAVGYAVSKRS